MSSATPEPADAEARRRTAPVRCYPADGLPAIDWTLVERITASLDPVDRVEVPPRDARWIRVPRGHVLRIACTEGPQVGDLNLFAAGDLSERFWSGKTRALHGSHVGLGDRLWSCLPHLRPLAVIVGDTLGWYGRDGDGGAVHDVIGTRCDPYTGRLLGGKMYHRCCHSNLTRALADATGMDLTRAEAHVHDVVNVFMCTGFARDTGAYFMKASPARAGDHLDLLAEIDLLAALSTCPGGDCGAEHSSDVAPCHPLRMEVLGSGASADWPEPARNDYDRSHGR